MRLYWARNTRAFRIAWLLEESGIPYERRTIDIKDETSRADADFRAASPMGKVPALVDGPARLSDSGAICIYIADRYPESGLGPPVGHADRARFLQWVTYTNSVVEPAMGERFAKLDPRPSSYGWGSFDLMLQTLKAGLVPGQWILGEKFSAADVLLGVSSFYLRRFGLVGPDAALDEYSARCQARPAWQRAQAFDSA
jgi:glutathione S-transferase